MLLYLLKPHQFSANDSWEKLEEQLNSAVEAAISEGILDEKVRKGDGYDYIGGAGFYGFVNLALKNLPTAISNRLKEDPVDFQELISLVEAAEAVARDYGGSKLNTACSDVLSAMEAENVSAPVSDMEIAIEDFLAQVKCICDLMEQMLHLQVKIMNE